MITGEVGLGKTLLCRSLLSDPPKGVRTAYIFNPNPNFSDLLQAIHYDLTGEHIKGETYSQLLDAMNDTLLKLAEKGERAAVLLDEAHRLSPELLEGLRLLSNLETEKEKLIYLILVGQPELERTLAMKEMRPLTQRISNRFRLIPFGLWETKGYINHRIQMVGKTESFYFSEQALFMTHLYSRGVPRRINQICDRALLACFAANKMVVGYRMVMRAANEISGKAWS